MGSRTFTITHAAKKKGYQLAYENHERSTLSSDDEPDRQQGKVHREDQP